MEGHGQKEARNSREVSCSFFVLCLLLGEESSKGNNVCLDLLLTDASRIAVRAVRLRHDCGGEVKVELSDVTERGFLETDCGIPR